MVIDGNFLFKENVVEVEKVLDSHEYVRVDEAVTSEESLEVWVLGVRLETIVKLGHVEVFFGIVKFIDIVFYVPFWEALSQEKFTCLERHIVDKWENVLLVGSIFHDLTPNIFIDTFSEEKIVDNIEHWWIVKSVSDRLKSAFKGCMQLRVA